MSPVKIEPEHVWVWALSDWGLANPLRRWSCIFSWSAMSQCAACYSMCWSTSPDSKASESMINNRNRNQVWFNAAAQLSNIKSDLRYVMLCFICSVIVYIVVSHYSVCICIGQSIWRTRSDQHDAQKLRDLCKRYLFNFERRALIDVDFSSFFDWLAEQQNGGMSLRWWLSFFSILCY